MYERSLPCWWVEWPPTASPSMPTICPDKTWNEFLKNMGRWVYIWLFNNNHGWFVYTEIGRLSEEEGDFYVRGCFFTNNPRVGTTLRVHAKHIACYIYY